MATSFKRTYARTVVLKAPDSTQPTVSPLSTHVFWRLPPTPRQVWLSLLWRHCSFLLSPGAHSVFFVASKSLFPQSWGSSAMKSHFKVKFPRSAQSLCQIPGLGNLLQALELLQRCENFFVIIVLHCVGSLLSGSVIGLTPRTSQVCCCQSPCPQGSHCWPVPPRETLKYSKAGLAQALWGPWVLLHTRFCLSLPSVSGGCGVWF